MHLKWDEFFVTGDPLILGAQISIALTSIAIVFVLTYFKKWKWLWKEWLTSVDHKKLGIMYILAAVIMFFRGGVDGLMMRAQLALPNNTFLDSNHYNEIFTTHGTIMILFMAMPFLIGLMNVVVPLQIGARDVAFPVFEQPELLDIYGRSDAVQHFLRHWRITKCRLDELHAARRK